MLKIALVDHHLNNFHADKFAGLLRGPFGEGKASLIAAYESHPTGEDWCVKQGVERAVSPEDAVHHADAVLLLAPDNVEAHLPLAKEIFAARKPIFFDKQLAAGLEDAREIVSLSRKYGTPIFSSSALWHAREVEAMLKEVGTNTITDVAAQGLGAWDRYGIHTLSMVLRLMGPGIQRVADTGTTTARTVTLDYGAGRRASLDVRSAANEWDVLGWSFAARVGENYHIGRVADFDGFYQNQLTAILNFFQTGEAPASAEELLTAIAVIEGVERSQSSDGGWQAISI